MKTTKKIVSWMLVLTMILSMCSVTAAAQRYTTATPSVSAEMKDGDLVVTVSAKGDLAMFDYGIAYNAAQVSVQRVEWDSEFLSNYLLAGGGIGDKGDKPDEQYVVLVGVNENNSKDWDGAIATITFAPKAGVKTIDPMKVYKDSAVEMKETGADTLAEVGRTPDATTGSITVEAGSTGKPGESSGTITGSSSIDANMEGEYLVISVSLKQDLRIFIYGLTYNAEQLEFEKIERNSEFREQYYQGMYDQGNMSSEQFIVFGGTHPDDSFMWDGEVLSITFRVKEGVKKIDSLKLIKEPWECIENTGAATLEETGAKPETESGMILIAVKEVTREAITNEDGTVTEKVTEKETKEDGSTVEKVTETTTATNGAVTEKVEEIVTDSDGNTTTTNKESVTNPDGSVKETEESVTVVDDEIIKILKELLQVTKDIYEKLTVIEKELADGTKVIKKLSETSGKNEDGEIIKETKVTDERVDKDGKGLEKFEYLLGSLASDIQWKIQEIKKDQMSEEEKKPFDKKGVKDYCTYDIIPESNGKQVDVSEGSVTVSFPCKDEWKGKKIRVFDFERNSWIDAKSDGKYVSFEAEHFSQYAIVAEVNYTLGNVDVDEENNITLKDAQLALRIALLLENDTTEEQKLAADVDENGTVQLADAQQILRRALLLLDDFVKAE